MNLLRDAVIKIAQMNLESANYIMQIGPDSSPFAVQMAQRLGVTPTEWFGSYVQDTTDFMVAGNIAKDAQTVLFDPDQALLLCRSLERFNDQPFFKLPFKNMVIQFSHPIPEESVFQVEPGHWGADPKLRQQTMAKNAAIMKELGININPKTIEAGDALLGIVLGEENGICNASAWFASTESQRVQWRLDDIDFMQYVNQFEFREGPDISIANKRKLQLLSMALIFYMNCKNIELERVAADPKVNRNRLRKGKKTLPDYYICNVRKTHYKVTYGEGAEEQHRQGSKHSFRYDVAGHFRRVDDGAIWIADHQRGIEHLTYKPKVRSVNTLGDGRVK